LSGKVVNPDGDLPDPDYGFFDEEAPAGPWPDGGWCRNCGVPIKWGRWCGDCVRMAAKALGAAIAAEAARRLFLWL